jgi:hypothetical protein
MNRIQIWIRRTNIYARLKIVREQNARSLELKLCLSIYDLYELRQRAGESRPQLKAVYDFFDEGFETADLLGAKLRLEKR